MRTACPAFARIAHRHLAHAVGIEVPGIGCFTVPPRDWQAVILADAVDLAASGGKPLITAAGALRKVRQRGWVRRRFSRLTDTEATAIRADGTLFDHPAKAIAAWATTLSRLGILLPAGAGDRWIVWQQTAGTMPERQTAKRV
jgi:2-keto-4-pentenoate hydratase